MLVQLLVVPFRRNDELEKLEKLGMQLPVRNLDGHHLAASQGTSSNSLKKYPRPYYTVCSAKWAPEMFMMCAESPTRQLSDLTDAIAFSIASHFASNDGPCEDFHPSVDCRLYTVAVD